jgi:hypothetical protein
MDRVLPYERSHMDYTEFFAALMRHNNITSPLLTSLPWTHSIGNNDNDIGNTDSNEMNGNHDNPCSNDGTDVDDKMVYYFGRSFNHLINDCQPNHLFWLTDDDKKVCTSHNAKEHISQ